MPGGFPIGRDGQGSPGSAGDAPDAGGRDGGVSTVPAGQLRSWRWGVKFVRPRRAWVTGAGCCITRSDDCTRGERKSRRPLSQRQGGRPSEFSSMPGLSRPWHGRLPWWDTPKTAALPPSPPNRAPPSVQTWSARRTARRWRARRRLARDAPAALAAIPVDILQTRASEAQLHRWTG